MGLYAEWPLIEFAPLNSSQSSLSGFSKETSVCVAELLLHEFADNLNGTKSSSTGFKDDTEEQFSWILQVTSYALTLSYSTNREYDALRAAVRIYCTWLNALSKDASSSEQANLPGPIKRDPEKYICMLLDTLRTLFVRSCNNPETPLIATRQAQEIENVLRAVTQISQGCKAECQHIVWPSVLKFLLNATDLLLSGQACDDDVTSLMASKVTKTLLDEFLCAARLEQIPSPLYWKTLSFLSKRWRHQVSFIENWARKVMSLSVLIVQEIYGENYCPINITDEQVKLFDRSKIPSDNNDDNIVPVLHVCWFQLMHMIGNPASIISFDPRTTGALRSNLLNAILATGGAMDSDGNAQIEKFDMELTEFTAGNLRRCFFMACAAVVKLVDIFYGDSRVSIGFRESDELMQHWSDLNRNLYEDWLRHQQVVPRSSSSSVSAAGDSATMTATQVVTAIGGGSGSVPKSTLGVPSISKSRAASERSLIAGIPAPSPAASAMEETAPEIPKPNSAQFVWHYLQSNRVQKPYLGERQPKVARMLDTFMDWLVQSSLVRPFRFSTGTFTFFGLWKVCSVHVEPSFISSYYDYRSSNYQDRSGFQCVAHDVIVTQTHAKHSNRKSVYSGLFASSFDPPPPPTYAHHLMRFFKYRAVSWSHRSKKHRQPGSSGWRIMNSHYSQEMSVLDARPYSTKKTRNNLRDTSSGSGISAVADAVRHQSMSSTGTIGTDETQPHQDATAAATSGTEGCAAAEGVGGGGGNVSASESAVSRRSFAHSVASSGDAHSALSNSFEWPEVDGISAGRAAALGALCRITCSKASKEMIADSQLAQFYKVVYEALLEKDRLMLCSLIYFGNSIFRLALKGVEILLPQFVQAIETVYTESVKLRLHPSIDEVQMRRAALSALSSIISWPTTFGNMVIGDPSKPHGNADGNSSSYIDAHPRIHRILIFALRNEDDPTNLHLTLAMCTILCEESCLYDLHNMEERNVEKEKNVRKSDGSPKQEYCTSVVRSVVSAICDNMCKPHWSSELSVCLAALDCLNAFSVMHQSLLFRKNDMLSTGFLVVASLCRFIDTQLMKPPPLHSRDLHSSVVAAYSSLSVWLCASPLLLETESCLATVAETIEFGLTGGKNLPASERKAASKRVDDAAENLLYTIFSILGHSRQDDIVDEKKLLYKYGSKAIDITKFRHFLVRQQTLFSIHEATKLSTISKGNPSLFFVLRSPYHAACTVLAQLHARPVEMDPSTTKTSSDDKENGHLQNGVKNSIDPKHTAKFFHIPAEFEKPHCKLDTVIPPLQPSSDTDRVIAELTDIRKRMSQGESCLRASDDRNVWLRKSLSKELSVLAAPTEPPTDCNAGRVLLYDLGLISEESYKAGDILLLDSTKNDFYNDLHRMVDRSPTKLLQSVRLFYVRDGQRSAVDILGNAMNLQNTSSQFCGLLSELGEGVEVETHPHWTGDWSTAFSAERKPREMDENLDHYIIDGFTHCLWWSDAHIEIAFTTPTERIRKLQSPSDGTNAPGDPTVVSSTGGNSVFDEHSDPEHSAIRTLQRDFGGRAMSQSSSDERSAGRASGSSGQSNKLLSETLPPLHAKSHSGLDSGSETKGSGSERITFVKRNPDQRIFVVFLERIEDMHYFPYEEMFPVTTDGSAYGDKNGASRPDLIAIFISQVENELVQINIIGDWTKCGLPGPLVDGCVVSNSALPNLLRHTIISIARRRTVELENYQLVPSKRRRAIQEFARKYALKKSYCDFVELLLEERLIS